jgi:hypothetical protein
MKLSNKKHVSKYACLIFIIIFINSCEKEENNHPFSVAYYTQDINNNKKHSFKEGENITFCLDVYNHTDELYLFRHTALFKTDIFRIFQKTENSDELYFGKPYTYLICRDTPIGIQSNDLYQLKVSLFNNKVIGYTVCEPNDSLYLAAGNYVSKFSYSYFFFNEKNSYTIDSLLLQIDFNITK